VSLTDPEPAIERERPAATPGSTPRPRRTRVLVIVALLGVLGLAAGAYALSRSGNAKPRASAAVTGTGTATVERRDLVATDSEPGTLGYADQRSVVNRISGTITSLPAQGAVVRPGGHLYGVDGHPVVLLDGSVPVYRELAAGISSGADIRELEINLVRLGFDPGRAIAVDDVFDSATTAAVERWQSHEGLPLTGVVELGRVVFLPGARRVGTISATLGSSATQGAGTGSTATSSGGSGSGASLESGHATPAMAETTYTPGSSRFQAAATKTTCPKGTEPELVTHGSAGEIRCVKRRAKPRTPKPRAKPKPKAPARKPKAQRPAAKATAPAKRTGKTASTSSTPAAGAAGGAAAGGGTGASGAASTPAGNTIMQTTSATRQVSVSLDASKQTLAQDGERVSVELPSTHTIDGRISAVSRVATSTSSTSSSSSGSSGSGSSGSSSTPSATVTVSVALPHAARVPPLDQAPVTVAFAQQTRRNVIAVPVTALIATAGGGYAVEIVQGSARHTVPVTPGLYAGGFVQISGDVAPGTTVSDSSE
jgi:hypothetical protein